PILTDNFGCTYLEQICIEVTEEILAGQARDLEDCISHDGIAVFNLEDVLVDISTDPMLTFSFHETEADARGNLNAISTNQTLLLADGAKTIWVRIHNVETLCNVYR